VNLHPWNLKVRNDLNKWYLILYNTYGMIPSCVVYLALFLWISICFKYQSMSLNQIHMTWLNLCSISVLNWNRQWNVNWYETSVKILVEGNTQCKNNHNLGNQNKYMLQISIDVIKPNTYSYGEVNNNIQHIKFCTCVEKLQLH
jgi:hypothetical protein